MYIWYSIQEYSNYSAMFYSITLTPTPDPDKRRTAPKWRSFARNLITHCSPLAPHLRRGASGVGQSWTQALRCRECSTQISNMFKFYPFKVWSCSTSSGSSLGRQVRELPFTYRLTPTTELLDTPHRRPKRLILGRLFDGGLLDMQESSVLDWVGSVDLVVRMLHPIWSRHQLPALVTGCHWSLHACYLRLV